MTLELKADENGRTFIVEACDNHFGSLDAAFTFIDAAEKIGAQYIKFQHHIWQEEMDETKEMSDNFDEPLHSFLQRCALKLEDHIKLINYCKNKNVDYLCTPFSYKAFEELYALGQRLFKIGSGEFQDFVFISKLSLFKDCSFIFSTGMCNEDEIKDTVNFLKFKKLDFALMNCVSEYPPKIGNPNYKYIKNLKENFPEYIIGQSDHSPSIGSSLAAITLGAQIIEKHVTLNTLFRGPDKDVSITVDDFSLLIKLSKDISPHAYTKVISSSEDKVRNWAYRGLVSKINLSPGDIIKLENITSKRPCIGIPSKDIDQVIGLKVKNIIKKGERLIWNNLEK